MRILIVDDNEDARLILRRTLESNGHHVEEAENGSMALEKAQVNPPDMIISDILMPVMDGFMLCREIRLDQVLQDIPFLFYSANYTDEQDEKLAFEMGADRYIRKPVDPTDFLNEISSTMATVKKGRIQSVLPDPQDDAIFKLYSERLVNKLESKMQELEQEMVMRKETEQELRLFRFLADQSNDAYFVIESDTGRFLDVNRKACETLGYSRKELLKKAVVDIEALLPDMEAWNLHLAKVRQTGDMLIEGEHRRKDGSLLPVEINIRTLTHQGTDYMVAVARDIRKQKKAQQALRESEEKYRSLVESSSDHIFMLSPDGVYLESNDRVAQFCMNKGSDLIGKRLEDVYGADAGEYREKLNLLSTTQSAQRFGHRLTSSSGRVIEHEDTLYPLLRDSILWAIGGICRDITEQKYLESQLRQAQKMEAVGRLAGGVAHDFNNMLSIISGYTELALSKISPADLIREDLDEVLKAAGRSADLTRQLLAFARRQAIAPLVIDLNASIENSKKMLLRLLGEDINLRFIPGAGLWPIKFDASQVDQILANFCINARDAITGVGNITIETENIVSDENYCRFHLDFTPGEYVLLRFSDSGAGMDKKTQESIFEPFFTTKEVGRGTGLGLATVYGIVKQNNGFIYVYSEPGKGTAFQIYIPRHQGPDEKTSEVIKEAPVSGSETILVVEDEAQILALCSTVLERLGYTVIAAVSPEKAISLCQAYEGKIHLLLTDVIMPGMNGRELRDRINAIKPGIKTLFMSGYTKEAIAHRGVLDEGIVFIQKPFSINTLSRKVRDILVEEDPAIKTM